MFDVCVSISFIAQHYLIGGDFGPENHLNAHLFKVQLIAAKATLNKHNYVIDIDMIKTFLNHIKATYSDKCLNDFDVFKDQNPSIEWFAKVIYDDFIIQYPKHDLNQLKVIVWEDEDCYASYENNNNTA